MPQVKYGTDDHRRRLKLQVLEKHAGEPVTETLCETLKTELEEAIRNEFPSASPQVTVAPLGLTAVNIRIGGQGVPK